jgi:hypothetical protein
MSPDDTIVFAVGAFITFLTVWGAVLIGVTSVQQRRHDLSIEEAQRDDITVTDRPGQ